jgi:hypothetical protein
VPRTESNSSNTLSETLEEGASCLNVLVMAEKEVEEPVPDDSSPSEPVDEAAKDGRVKEMGD